MPVDVGAVARLMVQITVRFSFMLRKLEDILGEESRIAVTHNYAPVCTLTFQS